MKEYFTPIFVLILVLLIGCNTPKPINSKSGINVGGLVEVELWASSNCIRKGDRLKLKATLTNRTERTQLFELQNQPVLDIRLSFRTKEGTAILRWSDDKPMTSDLTRVELEPNESKSIEMDWIVDDRPLGPAYPEAVFIYSDQAPTGPVRPGVIVGVNSCPGPLGP